MALSKKVLESLEETKSTIRNAMWYAAKNESPITIKHIGDVLLAVEGIIKKEELNDQLNSLMDNMKTDEDGHF